MLEAAVGVQTKPLIKSITVHTDDQADQLAKQLGAIAFTTGSKIFFRKGAYQPFDAKGFGLLVHESEHVGQQARGEVSGGDPDAGLETKAQEAGSKAKN